MTNRSSKTQPKSTIGAVRYVYVQFIRPHRMHRIDEAFATLCRTFHDVRVSVCVSGTPVGPAKTTERIEIHARLRCGLMSHYFEHLFLELYLFCSVL